MGAATKESIKMKVFPKGQIVIPVSLRKKYQIEIGDQIDVIPESEGILLKPLAKEQRGKSATGRLFGIFNGSSCCCYSFFFVCKSFCIRHPYSPILYR